jgi:hypothetical protein
MSIAHLKNLYPAFGLLPDVAEFIHFAPMPGDGAGQAAYWDAFAPPKDLAALHNPEFLARMWHRLQVQVRAPISQIRSDSGRRVLKLLGSFVLVEQVNGCWRVYEWSCRALGNVELVPISDNHIVAQDMPYGAAWLKTLVEPVALEMRGYYATSGRAVPLANYERYAAWALLGLFAGRLARRGDLRALRRRIGECLSLDRWVLGIANRLLRPHNMPQQALLSGYKCVLRNRRAFAKLENDAPHLTSLYGVLCQAKGFPAQGEPVQRLKEYLIARGVSQRTWRVISRSSQRLWLIVNRFYKGKLSDSVLDFIRCIYGGPTARYPDYAEEVQGLQQVWRHVVRLMQGIGVPTEAQESELDRVVRWIHADQPETLAPTKREAGWQWLVRRSQNWETQQELGMQSQFRRWPVPMTEVMLEGYCFRFLDNALALWLEGRAMHHCAHQYAGKCAAGELLLMSVQVDACRLATLALTHSEEGWHVSQLAGKANRPCGKQVLRASQALAVRLNNWTDRRPIETTKSRAPMASVPGHLVAPGARWSATTG